MTDYTSLVTGLSVALGLVSVCLGISGIIIKANCSECDEVDICFGLVKYKKTKFDTHTEP